MTSPTYPVFEGDGGAHTPLRPTASLHLGGLEFQDHPTHPPTDRRRMSSTDFMQSTMTIERCASVVPVLQVDCTGHATTPTINSVASANTTLTSSNVTISRTGTGAYDIQWPSSKLPPATIRPRAFVSTADRRISWSQTGNTISVACVVASTGSATDSCAFSIDCFGGA